MYSVKFELPLERLLRREENRGRRQPSATYMRGNVERIVFLHDTKGYRDRNNDLLLAHQFIVGDLAERGQRIREAHQRAIAAREAEKKACGVGRAS